MAGFTRAFVPGTKLAAHAKTEGHLHSRGPNARICRVAESVWFIARQHTHTESPRRITYSILWKWYFSTVTKNHVRIQMIASRAEPQHVLSVRRDNIRRINKHCPGHQPHQPSSDYTHTQTLGAYISSARLVWSTLAAHEKWSTLFLFLFA